jgi:uncharacterized protein YdgA (DUF945 family)
MKKLWISIAVIVVLVAAWFGTTWYTGSRIEAETTAALAQLNDVWSKTATAAAPMPRVKQISYERGLLTSRARYAVTSHLLKNDEPLAEFDLTISHGPFPLTALQRGQLAPRQFDAHGELLAMGPLKTMTGALMNGKSPLVMDFGCSYGKHCTGTGKVPPIDFDFGPVAKNANLTFGGIEMDMEMTIQSDTDYQTNADARLLPLSIAGQDFGSGRITASGDAQSAHEVISWKTDKGESKFTLSMTAAQPMPIGNNLSVSLEDLLKLLKSVAGKAELSKPMLVDLLARIASLSQGVDLAAAQQHAQAQFDAILTSSPETGKFIHAEGDLLISDWQYADGKLTINGQERPEILEQIKQTYLAGLQSDGDATDAPRSEAEEPEAAPDKASSGQ